jgi:hypothetical protein
MVSIRDLVKYGAQLLLGFNNDGFAHQPVLFVT